MSLLDSFRDRARDQARKIAADAAFWTNVLLGIGDVRDPARRWQFTKGVELQDDELENLYDWNPVAQTIVNAIVEDGLRQGFETPGESDEELQKAAREKKALKMVARAAKWGRAFGGAVIIADTGDDLALPMPEEGTIRPGTLKRFIVRSRMEVQPVYPYDIEEGAEHFDLAPIQGGTTIRVHRSRLRVFDGEECSLRRRLHRQGWGLSKLEVVYSTMQSNAAQYDAADRIVQDLSQGVFKLHGVVDALSNDEGEDAQVFLQRVRNMDRARGIANALVLDAEENESFEQVGRQNVTGLPAVLDKSDQRLAMAAGMPVTRLMGISPAGLNATGEADIRRWYDEVKSYRRDHIEPVLEWVLRLVAMDAGIAISEDEDLITWPSLWQRTPTEEDDRKAKILGMYGAASQQGLLLPEEATNAVIETGAFPEIELDTVKRKAKEDLADKLRAQLGQAGPPGAREGESDNEGEDPPDGPPPPPGADDGSEDDDEES